MDRNINNDDVVYADHEAIQGSMPMSRPLRIEYPGAIYHLTSRGNARSDIYRTRQDRQAFLDILAQTCERHRWQCYAWCLMTNHYHLVIQTEQANLSHGMRHLNGVYTQEFNRRHRRVGHLFQGRYKAILVDKDSYLLEVIRYVLLNPVRANMTQTAGQYPWSSYRSMIGKVSAPKWLARDRVLGHFSQRLVTAQKHFIKFMQEGKGQSPLWENLRQQLYLGDEAFVHRLPLKAGNDPTLIEVPREQRQRLGKPLSHYSKKYIQRDDAIYAAFQCGQYTQKEIARHFDLHYSTVSKIVKRYEKKDEEISA